MRPLLTARVGHQNSSYPGSKRGIARATSLPLNVNLAGTEHLAGTGTLFSITLFLCLGQDCEL